MLTLKAWGFYGQGINADCVRVLDINLCFPKLRSAHLKRSRMATCQKCK